MLKNKNFNWTAMLSYAFYGIFVALFIGTILQNPNYIFGDNEKFMLEYAKGGKTIFPLAWGGRDYWPSFGRFWPMYFQEYNILCFFPGLMSRENIVFGCYLLNSSLFLIFAICSFLLLKRIISSLHVDFTSPWIAPLFPLMLLFFFFNSEFDRCFWDIIFAEKALVVLLSVYLLSYYSAYKSERNVVCILSYSTAAVSAVLMTYYKESAFLFSLIPACVWLLFAYKTMTKEHRLFCFFIIINAVIFLLLYYFVAYRRASQFYNEGRYALSPFETAYKVFAENYTIAFMFASATVRAFFVVFFKNRKHLFFDAVLFSGAAVSCAFFVLKLPETYYYVPVFFCSVIVYLYWLVLLGQKYSFLPLCLLLISILSFVFLNHTQENFLTLYHLVQRGKTGDYPFAQKLVDRVEPGGRLYYINSAQNGYLLGPFSTFIRYVSKAVHSEKLLVVQEGHIPENLTENDLLIFLREDPKFLELLENSTFELFAEHHLFTVLQKKKMMSFSSLVDFSRIVSLKGFSSPEPEGRWIISNTAIVRLNVHPTNVDLFCSLKFTPFLLPEIPKRQVSVWCNGEKIKEWTYTMSSPGNGTEIFVLPKKTTKKGYVHLQFRTEPLISPKELGINEDSRTLGIFMRKLTIEPIPTFEKGDEINFSDPALETSGFFQIEPTGRWTVESGATLNFNAFRISPYHDLNLAFTLIPCLSPKYPEKTVQVFANDIFITTWKMTAQEKYPVVKELRIPQKVLLSSEGKLVLRFDIFPLFTLKSENISPDVRLLGIHFMKVKQE